MTVFVAAGDETERGDQTGPFVFGGYVAAFQDWQDWFAPAWEERVLNLPPRIPYLHMAEIRSQHWRDKHGLTYAQAEYRVDEATRVIGSMGSLHFVKNEIDGDHFRHIFGETKLIKPGKQPGIYPMKPDYVGFLGFAYAALEYISTNHPHAEKVDFAIERKTGVTHRIDDFSEGIAKGLRRKGEGHLVPLIGKVIPGGKERVDLQAADVALWHLERHDRGELSSADQRRARWLFHDRPMTINGLTNAEISELGVRSKAKSVPSPFKPKWKPDCDG